MNWNRFEEAFHPFRTEGNDSKPTTCWRGGNLPKLNSFVMGLEEIYHGLFIAAQHDLGEMVAHVVPRIRRLCDAAISLVEVWKGQHDDGCGCRVCKAVAELHTAWRALDNDEATP